MEIDNFGKLDINTGLKEKKLQIKTGCENFVSTVVEESKSKDDEMFQKESEMKEEVFL